MPTYEYKCASCDNRYEMRQGFDAPPRQDCPRCGAIAKRVLYAPPIVFKGSGFYITDSRKGSSATIADPSGGSTPGASETKSEAAPAAPAAPAAAADG